MRAKKKQRVSAPEWEFQAAKARFNQLCGRACTEGPQRITRRGKAGVVVLSQEDYEELIASTRKPKTLWDFFRESPLVGVELDLERKKDVARDIEL